jgi:hypothetical protein
MPQAKICPTPPDDFGNFPRMAKVTTDQCLKLCAGDLMKRGILAPNLRGTRLLALKYPVTGEECGRIGINAQIGDDGGVIRLLYGVDRHGAPFVTASAGYDVVALTTPLAWGKLRWWLVCPSCEERGDLVAALFLPPGARRFGCRRCHNLAYRSSQESRKPAAPAAA